MAGVAFAVEGDGVGFATESYAASALCTTLASLSGTLWRIRRVSHAKALRANMTEAERRLWYFLRAHRFKGMKFKRQAMIGRYIVDFVSFQRSLVIEVDGGQHADNEADGRRARWLEGQGFRVLRFWNNEVLNNCGGVLDV